VMQEQLMELQERVARLEAMGDRLERLEQGQLQGRSIEEASKPIEHFEPEADPLLSRLAPFLEDF
jgi:hypothetical protein